MIAIIDYGMGNIHSVNKALEFYGAKTIVTNKTKDIGAAKKAVLPGVGAFDDAVSELEKQGLVQAIKEFIGGGRPFLGICLGMQLLFEASQEAGQSKGLGILKGEVVKFRQEGLKVPHMGWNQIKFEVRSSKFEVKKCPLLNGLPDNAYVYFCHSYYPEPMNKDIIAATTDYGTDFASVVWQDNIYGAQFHPEKSQSVGLRMLKNFVEL
jgi:glutamine amidotransferase